MTHMGTNRGVRDVAGALGPDPGSASIQNGGGAELLLVAAGCSWFDFVGLVSCGFMWLHFKWFPVVSRGFMRFHVASCGFMWLASLLEGARYCCSP